MRIASILSTVLVVGATLAAAWSKEDYEIFRVKDEIESTEGEGVSFYNYLGLKSASASLDDINKAFKKASLRMHPDKHRPVVPESEPGKPPRKLTKRAIREQKRVAQEKYARLLTATKILRENRDRYDHFLKNGFPKWKGTGYYYARFRPGLGSVLVGLFVFVGGFAHWGLMHLTVRQQKQFLQRFMDDARTTAWGPSGVAGVDTTTTTTVSADSADTTATEEKQPEQPRQPVNRRERRFQKRKGGGPTEEEQANSQPAKPVVVGSAGEGRRKVQASNGKILIVESSGDVYLVEEDKATGEEIETKLDISDIGPPSFKDTAMVKLPLFIFNKTVGRFLPGAKKDAEAAYEEVDTDVGDVTSGADDVLSGSDAGVASKVSAKAGKALKREGLPRRKTPNRGKSLTQMKAEKAQAEAEKAAQKEQQ